jgi:hypothetical protein
MSLGRIGLVIGLLIVVLLTAVLALALVRPSTTVAVAGVTVECANTADESRCAAWAESVLEDGPGIHTFDPDDLERVRLSRSLLGLAGDCQAEYFVGRSEDPVANETVACPGD